MIQRDSHIVLTGATGFLGCYLLRLLLHKGYTNITCTHRSTSRFILIEDIKDQVTWVQCDLTDELEVESLLQNKVDAIIHAAAKVSLSNKNQKSLMRSNVDSTRLLADYALDRGVQKFVFVSSVASIGPGLQQELIHEETEWKDDADNTAYGVSKQYAEREVMRAVAEGLEAVIINPSMIIGAGEWNSSTVSIIQMVDKGLPYYPSGSIGLIDVRDVAELIVLALENEGLSGKRFIASAENWTHQKIIESISKTLGKNAPQKQLPAVVARLGIIAATISEWVKGDKSILNAQSIKMSQESLEYDHAKSIRLFDFNYRSIDQSIKDIVEVFNHCKEASLEFGLLDIED